MSNEIKYIADLRVVAENFRPHIVTGRLALKTSDNRIGVFNISTDYTNRSRPPTVCVLGPIIHTSFVYIPNQMFGVNVDPLKSSSDQGLAYIYYQRQIASCYLTAWEKGCERNWMHSKQIVLELSGVQIRPDKHGIAHDWLNALLEEGGKIRRR